MRKKLVRGMIGLLAVCFAVAGVASAIWGPRLVGWPMTLLFVFGAIVMVSQFVTFAVTGVSPFRADRLKDARERRAARRKRANL